MKSDIFNEYAKSMITAGMVKTAQSEESKPKEKSFSEKAYAETIQALYGVNVDEENMTEKAHPETAVIGRAYDAMNAVVENNQQRNDVMTWIALKMPNGHITHRRYVEAKSNLMSSLVQVGFKADAENKEDLMKLADSCAGELSKKAIAPVAVLGVAAVVGALGLMGWLIHGDVSVQSVFQNAKLLLDELKDVPEKPYAAKLTEITSKLMEDATVYNEIKGRVIERSLNMDSLIDKVKDPQVQQDFGELTRIRKSWSDFLKLYPVYYNAVTMSMQTGSDAGSSDWASKLMELGKFVWRGEEQQVLDYLEGLASSVTQAIQQSEQIVSQFRGKAEQIAPEIQKRLEERKDEGDFFDNLVPKKKEEKRGPEQVATTIPSYRGGAFSADDGE